ncbi:MAG: RagB/SusD family nutrient uptake outer membrane protein [Parabacteroides sp.]|nr:RagB/SusD family nutrient uptake outer membrane protein [Parabacteroides sp.]
MKLYKLLVLLIIGFSSCEDNLLNLESLTEPVDDVFYKNEEELNLALNGAYNSLRLTTDYKVPLMVAMDNGATDIGVSRGLCSAMMNQGQGVQSPTNDGFLTIYSDHYKGIARANALLENMARSKDVVPEDKYKQIEAQALFVRAFHYMYLTELFGDVPFLNKVIKTPAEGLIPRESKEVIVEQILADLKKASEALPYSWKDEPERVTKGAAIGLYARIALYNARYAEAAAAAKEIMDNEPSFGYSLHKNYGELFQLAGQTSSEIMFVMPFKYEYFFTQFSVTQGSRNLGSVSVMVPTQSMIDSYECTDGETIDKSEVYSPKQPFENRDPRLKASIITPQSQWAGLIFESHPDSVNFRLVDGKIGGSNKDCRTVSWPAAFCGYLWKKNTIEETQKKIQSWDDHHFILMRYAEILLIYAESKIMLGEIDESVLNAINRIRARAYGAGVADTDQYPAVQTRDAAKLKTILRRERKVELADEGFRLFDIRRWKIAEKVMPVTIYGRILDTATATGVPRIDEDGLAHYQGIEQQYDLNKDDRFPNATRMFNPGRDYLCPIPQQEIDTYARFGVTLSQNAGY